MIPNLFYTSLPINDKTITRAIDSVFVRLKTILSNKLKKRMSSGGQEIELENRVEDKLEDEVEEHNVVKTEL